MDEIQRNEWMSETDSESRIEEKSRKGISKRVWHCCMMGFLLGSIICGIALAIVIVMFVQDSKRLATSAMNNTRLSPTVTTIITSTTVTTETTTTTSTTLTTTTTTLPNQCYSYMFINDPTRLTTASVGLACDNTFSTLTWVRFAGSGGTKIPDSPPSMYTCGTYYPGWYTGIYPSAEGLTTSGAVCFVYTSYTCMWASGIYVTNCGTYYVFGLTDAPGCYMRYCTV